MRVLIVEDETLAAQRLQHLLKECDSTIEIAGVAESVEETIEVLGKQPATDLLLMDIQLSDGYSFEIFKKVDIKTPVIFTTAYDQFALEAFKHFSIDYILKPVTGIALKLALEKYKLMTTYLSPDYAGFMSTLATLQTSNNYKNRFLAKVGQRLFFVEANDVAYFQADNKIVYLIDKEGNRFVIDYTLEKLEAVLDPRLFFRLNRKFIIKVSAIDHIKPFYNNRLKLCIKGTAVNDEMIISRERVAEFKAWAEA